MFNSRADVMFALIILLIMKFIFILSLIIVLTFAIGCTIAIGIMFFLLNYQNNPPYCIIGEGIIVSAICLYIWLIRVLRACLD